MSFQPTVLIVKEHTLTGLKYFHKTSKLTKLGTYAGSGKLWKRHLNKHGNYWKNLWISEVFSSEDDCKAFAAFFSEFFNVANDSRWANLIPENGVDGGDNPAAYSITAKARRIQTLKKNAIKWTHTDKFKSEQAKTMKSYWDSDSGSGRKKALRLGSLKEFELQFVGPHKPPGWFVNNKTQHKCTYCEASGDLRNMRRWHFENCKRK